MAGVVVILTVYCSEFRHCAKRKTVSGNAPTTLVRKQNSSKMKKMPNRTINLHQQKYIKKG